MRGRRSGCMAVLVRQPTNCVVTSVKTFDTPVMHPDHMFLLGGSVSQEASDDPWIMAQQRRRFAPMLVNFWPSIGDCGPMLIQHRSTTHV